MNPDHLADPSLRGITIRTACFFTQHLLKQPRRSHVRSRGTHRDHDYARTSCYHKLPDNQACAIHRLDHPL